MMIMGTAGDDDLTGTGTADDFYLGDGGDDIAHGLAGDDSFAFGAEFTGHDSVFGGSGNDTVLIGGAAGTLHITGTTIDSVESLLLLDGSDYTLSMKNSAVDDGKTLVVDGGGLSIGHSLRLFASTELDGNYVAVGGADNDIFETGAGNDTIYGGDGTDAIQSGYGRDTINAGSGDDTIYFIGDGALGAGDRANGGGGSFADTLDLSGDYSAGLTITAKMLADIDIFKLEAGNDYTLDFSRANAGLFNLVLDGGALGASDVLNFTAAENKHVSFFVQGGAANDAIAVGTAVNNYLQGGGGADTLTGNTNVDVFSYVETADSGGYDECFPTVGPCTLPSDVERYGGLALPDHAGQYRS